MNHKRHYPFFPAALLAGIVLLAAFFPLFPRVGLAGVDQGESIPFDGQMLVVLGEPGNDSFIPPPSALRINSPALANIQVNYAGSWDPQAQAAFEYAVSIWESLITSPVTITVDANWSSLGPGILGGANFGNVFRDFSGAPQASTWYPSALAEKLFGGNLSGVEPDINAQFNSGYPGWYFGTDGNPGSKIDFVTVVLHELGHGLGFAGSMQQTGVGTASWGVYDGSVKFPTIYDRFTENSAGAPLISFDGAPLYAQLTSGNIYFDGSNANNANAGQRVRLYAPSTWAQGSSFAHLDETFNGTSHSLMTFSVGPGEAVHNPGSVTLGMFRDMGWSIPGSPPTPTVPPFTPVAWNYIPYALRSYSGQIAGRLLVNSTAAANVSVQLMSFNSVSGNSTLINSALTGPDGRFVFVNPSPPPADNFYYLRYDNRSALTPGRLWLWESRLLLEFRSGINIDLGNNNIADVPLLTPVDDASVIFPVAFTWASRSGSPGDRYRLHLVNLDASDQVTFEWFLEPPTASVQHVLNSLPAGYPSGGMNYWDVWVLDSKGGGGISLGYHWINYSTFAQSSAAQTRPLRGEDASTIPYRQSIP